MPAMISLFAVPDIAGAIEYPKDKNVDRYTRWFDEYVTPLEAGMDGQLAWMVRNALIHESAMNWRTSGFDTDRLLVMPPNPQNTGIHNISIIGPTTKPAHTVMLDKLAPAILSGAEEWLKAAEQSEEKRGRIDGMMQMRPNGMHPFIGGVPVIT